MNLTALSRRYKTISFALTSFSQLCYGFHRKVERLVAINAGNYFQQKLVVADESCLPISSFNYRAWAGKLLPMTRNRIEMPWEVKAPWHFF
jgi:hypothetical protein